MKKLLVYFISVLSAICMLIGFFLKREVLFSFGFFLHFIDATYVTLIEYKSSNKFTFNTIFYPIALIILTFIIIYRWIVG